MSMIVQCSEKEKKTVSYLSNACLKFYDLRVRYALDFQHSFRVNVPFRDGFFNALLAHEVHYGRIVNQANSLFNACLSTFVELVFHVEDNLAFSKRSSQQVAVADG
jgi:hypothetical protein